MGVGLKGTISTNPYPGVASTLKRLLPHAVSPSLARLGFGKYLLGQLNFCVLTHNTSCAANPE